MNAIELIRKQLESNHASLTAIATDLTDTEWVSRIAPGCNPIGFTIWHMARQQDNTVQCMIRGVIEVITEIRWITAAGLATPGTGAGFTDEEVDALIRVISRDDVLAYANAVHAEISGWLPHLRESDLDLVPNMRMHLAPHAAYQRQSYQEAINGLYNQPMWRLLAGVGIGHTRSHIGEIATLKAVMRAQKAA